MTNFMSLKDASAVTGLSVHFLRNGCREKRIPHIVTGNSKYMVNVPLLIEKLNRESEGLDGEQKDV